MKIYLDALNNRGQPYRDFKQELERQAVEKRIVLGDQGVVRNEERERMHARETMGAQDRGFLFGLDEELPSLVGNALHGYAISLQQIPDQYRAERSLIGQYQAIIDLRTSDLMRSIWAEAKTDVRDARSRHMMDVIDSYLSSVQAMPTRAVLSGYERARNIYAELSNVLVWRNIYAAVGEVALRRTDALEQELRFPQLAAAKEYLKTQDSSRTNNIIYANAAWNGRFLEKNVLAVLEFGARQDVDTRIVVTTYFGERLQQLIAEQHPRIPLEVRIMHEPLT